MQIKIKDNSKEFAKQLSDTHKKQIPFATSQAINTTLFALKKEMAKQTEKKLDRPIPFTKRGFMVTRSTKTNMSGKLFIEKAREKYMQWVIDGGVRKGTSKKIPVPTKYKNLNKYGNIAGKRGGLVKGKQQFIGTIGGVSGVFERYNNNKSVKLLIKFEDSVTYDKGMFDFYKIGTKYINNTYARNLFQSIIKALKTAK